VDGEPAPKAPPIVLVTPEAAGAVVTLSDVKASGSAISANLIAPREPGLYRLSVSVHDGDGVAFSRRTQDRIPALIVRVTGVLSALVSATDRLQVVAGATVELPVAVANTGQLAWVIKPPVTSGPDAQPDIAPGEWHSVLVGQWLRLDAPGETSEAVAARATVHPDPGDTEQLSLSFIAPVVPGDYLLVLDVVSPLYGSLTAAGGSPVVVRVAVEQPEIPQPVVEGPQADQGSPTGSGAEATSDAGKGN
jgi:hypothetical protein